MQILETTRTFLRELVPADDQDVLRIFSDPAAMEFAPFPPTADLSAVAAFIQWNLDNYRRKGMSTWAVMLKQTGRFIGQAGLIPHDTGVEIFYALIPEFWNLGIATEVAAGCRNHALNALQLPRLISIIHPGNQRAIKVALKIGMKQNGTIHLWNRENLLFELHRKDSAPT